MEEYLAFKKSRTILRVKSLFNKQSCTLLFLILVTIISDNSVVGCRSSVDQDRAPIYSHHVSF